MSLVKGVEEKLTPKLHHRTAYVGILPRCLYTGGTESHPRIPTSKGQEHRVHIAVQGWVAKYSGHGECTIPNFRGLWINAATYMTKWTYIPGLSPRTRSSALTRYLDWVQ